MLPLQATYNDQLQAENRLAQSADEFFAELCLLSVRMLLCAVHFQRIQRWVLTVGFLFFFFLKNLNRFLINKNFGYLNSWIFFSHSLEPLINFEIFLNRQTPRTPVRIRNADASSPSAEGSSGCFVAVRTASCNWRPASVKFVKFVNKIANKNY